MNKEDVKEGLFITNKNDDDSFAILYGYEYTDEETNEGEQLLYCYYTPFFFEEDIDGNWSSEPEVFSCEYSEEFETCEYTIPNSLLKEWRISTDEEIKKHLDVIYSHNLIWNSEYYKFIPNQNKNSHSIYNFDHVFLYKDWSQNSPLTIMDEKRKEIIMNSIKNALKDVKAF